MKDQDGQPLHVETLPMPEPVYFAGQRLPASHANFYIASKQVLVPTFSDPSDLLPWPKWQDCFQIAPWSAFPAAISSLAWERSTV